jgi:hypothetical protein
MRYSHQQVEPIFSAALARSDADEQRRFLDEACGGDPMLREQIETLLRNYDEGEDLLEEPAVTWMPPDDDSWGANPQTPESVANPSSPMVGMKSRIFGDGRQKVFTTFPF